jgi:parvulin-like peptidyl-prolyl isomerase
MATGGVLHAGQQERKDPGAARQVIAARVNGAEITMASVIIMMNRLGGLKARDATDVPAPEDIEVIKKAALDRLIFEELAYQKAKNLGITANQEAIDRSMRAAKDNVGGDAEFQKFLEREHMTEHDMRARVERGLMIEAVFAREVYEKAFIPVDKVRESYDREKYRYVKPERALVVDVFVFKKEGQDAAARASELLNRIRSDKDNDPWKLVLDGTFIVRNYPVNKKKDTELYETAISLKPGELSGIIKAGDGFHIIKVKEYTPERYYTFEESRGAIEKKFRVEAQQHRAREWEQDLKKDSRIEIIQSPDQAQH